MTTRLVTTPMGEAPSMTKIGTASKDTVGRGTTGRGTAGRGTASKDTAGSGTAGRGTAGSLVESPLLAALMVKTPLRLIMCDLARLVAVRSTCCNAPMPRLPSLIFFLAFFIVSDVISPFLQCLFSCFSLLASILCPVSFPGTSVKHIFTRGLGH